MYLSSNKYFGQEHGFWSLQEWGVLSLLETSRGDACL